MDSYLDVIGTASVTETISESRADLTISVRAAKNEAAVAEVAELREACIRQLRAAGLEDAHLKEGAGELWQAWFWRKNPGQEASRRILVAHEDVELLFRALQSLEDVFTNQRHSLSVRMNTPKFDASPEALDAARRAALEDARTAAQTLADASGVALAGVLQVEELRHDLGHSGSYGDEDWGYAVAVAAGGTVEEESTPLQNADRSRVLRFRVRFAVTPR